MFSAFALVWAPGAQATFPGSNGKIAFNSGASANGWGTLYTVDPNGSNLTRLTPQTGAEEREPGWSADGTKMVFTSRPSSQAEGFLWVMNADGSDRRQLTFDDASAFHNDGSGAWSPDGTKIVFIRNFPQARPACSEIFEVNADGSGVHQLAPTPACHDRAVSWSPDGTKLAYESFDDYAPSSLYVANPDNTNPIRIGSGSVPSWAPGSGFIAFADYYRIYITTPNGGTPRFVADGDHPAWSPDGNRIAVDGIDTFDEGGGSRTHIAGTPYGDSRPSWQPLASPPPPPPPPPEPGYPRPRGASPLVVPLVPAFERCTTQNRTHGPPLAFGSCTPPVQTSAYLTVGTPDANGSPADSTGSVKFVVIPGDPSTAANEADVQLTARLTDVRCMQPTACAGPEPLAAYVGRLDVSFTFQLTDRYNGGSGTVPATATPPWYSALHFVVPCAATADPTAGGTCQLTTGFNALSPGTIREGKRAIWELGAIRVFDGGGSGDPTVYNGNAPSTLFADQGLFVP